MSDTGPGIPSEECERMLEKIRQVDSSNTRAKGGRGLGFAIAREIVEMHGAGSRAAKRSVIIRPKGTSEGGCYLAVIYCANRAVMADPIEINCRNRAGTDPCVEYPLDGFLRTQATMEDNNEQ